MIGERPPQQSLLAADALYLDLVGCDTFYGQLAQHRSRLFRDQDFADLYQEGGRYPISPRLLACLTLLQYTHKASDRQAVDTSLMRRDWRIALGRDKDYEGSYASVLCHFCQRLTGHAEARRLFERVLQRVQRLGLLRRHQRVQGDATHVLANVAVLSRGEMLREALRIVLRDLARVRRLDRPHTPPRQQRRA